MTDKAYYRKESTNTAYLRGHARGRTAFRRDQRLFGYRRASAAKKIVQEATRLALAEKLALECGFIDGAELQSIEMGWRTA